MRSIRTVVSVCKSTFIVRFKQREHTKKNTFQCLQNNKLSNTQKFPSFHFFLSLSCVPHGEGSKKIATATAYSEKKKMCEVPKKRLGYPAANPSCNQRSWHLHVPFRNRKGVNGSGNGSGKGQIAKGCGTGDPIRCCTVCGAAYAKCLMEIWHTNRIKQKTSLRRNAKCALYLFNVYLYLSIYLCLCVCISVYLRVGLGHP